MMEPDAPGATTPTVESLLRRFIDPIDELGAWVRDSGGVDLADARLLNDKGWSLVLHLGPAVLKLTARGMFPDGPRMFELVGRAAQPLVPELIAWRSFADGTQAMLFRTFEGIAVESVPLADRPDALVSMARSTARIQAAVSGLSPSGLATVRASDVPAMLDEILDDIVSRCRADHAAAWSVHCRRQEVADDFHLDARRWRAAVAEWALELEAGGWSASVDHVDLLPHNANLLPDGACLVYDWEQAAIGVPFFSLDILLAYAQCIDEGHDGLVLQPERSTRTQEKISEAYLEELPGPMELALRLAPLRYCSLEWNQAASAGVAHYAVDDVAWWLSRALRRWTV